MEQIQNQNKMGILPEGKLLLSMSVPLCISMLMQAIYNLVDSIFVSRLGEDALTAVSLAYPVQMLMIAVSVGTGVGMNSLISRRLGERRLEEANRAANNGIVLLLISAAVFTLFGVFGAKPFFDLFTDVQQIREIYREVYAGPVVRYVVSPDENGFLSAGALSGSDGMEISVSGNDARILLTARYDNLGKGASGAAIQNLNLLLGADETAGLVL